MISSPTRTLFRIALAAGALALSAPASADLREPEVLVLYDSRISDSLLVAEHYAGSAKVPGGVTGVAGARPRVLVLNLSTLAAVGASGQAGFAATTPDIDYDTFKQRLRDPIRNYLAANNLTRRIRSLVMTKGLPHRITDRVNPGLGDNPGLVGSQFCAGNETFSSVDIELALLWQNLDAGEAGGKGDSYRDGWIDNPYYGEFQPHAAWPRSSITSPKTLSVAPYNIGCGTAPDSLKGVWWLVITPLNPANPASLTPGDLYMVCRLDGNTVNDVRGMINRAQNIQVNTLTSAFILDRDAEHNYDLGTYSNVNIVLSEDGRYNAANLLYNEASNVPGFFVGPNIAFGGGPMVVTNPILMLASFGANHTGITQPMSTTYGNSFNWAAGGVFNTLESYNGRAFGGLGQNQFAAQQQAADAIGAGATFALANVYEPTTLSVGNNQFVAQSFFAGYAYPEGLGLPTPPLSWAEAAYTALPELSWTQIVLGDPLARIRRDTEDRHPDGKITIDDLYAWHAAPNDINRDGVSDSTDYRYLESVVRGHELVNMKADQR